MSLPKYVSHWYIQDAIKKATRDCMYYGQNHPQCKASWKDVECVEAYFNDKFKIFPIVSKDDTEKCLKNNIELLSNANLREDSHWQNHHHGG